MTVEKLDSKNSKAAPKPTTTKTATTKTETIKADTTKPEATQSLALSVPQRTTLPQNRPVEPSHLEVVKTYSSVGSARPVTKSGIEISSTMTISGNRPITLSGLQISETSLVMGNRPVASNEIDDAATLMGYLD